MKSPNPRKASTGLAAFLLAACCVLCASSASADSDRILATGGVTDVEGSAGGGISPWAVIAGYGTDSQSDATGFYTNVTTPNFTLNDIGLAGGFDDRVEVSGASQRFCLGPTGDLALKVGPNYELRQNVLGVKVRLLGDVIYDQDSWLPQLAVGVHYYDNTSRLGGASTVKALGAKDDTGEDFYVVGTKLWIGGFFGRDLLANVTLRATKANQAGLLGFGGDLDNSYKLEPEVSLAVLLNDTVAVGGEYRRMPQELSIATQRDWADAFVAYFPNKNLSLTFGYATLGTIAGAPNQNGLYLSGTVTF
ncbi:MAG: DUF3034 family protein [Candidatus Dormibacteraceae bacterium]